MRVASVSSIAKNVTRATHKRSTELSARDLSGTIANAATHTHSRSLKQLEMMGENCCTMCCTPLLPTAAACCGQLYASADVALTLKSIELACHPTFGHDRPALRAQGPQRSARAANPLREAAIPLREAGPRDRYLCSEPILSHKCVFYYHFIIKHRNSWNLVHVCLLFTFAMHVLSTLRHLPVELLEIIRYQV